MTVPLGMPAESMWTYLPARAQSSEDYSIIDEVGIFIVEKKQQQQNRR